VRGTHPLRWRIHVAAFLLPATSQRSAVLSSLGMTLINAWLGGTWRRSNARGAPLNVIASGMPHPLTCLV